MIQEYTLKKNMNYVLTKIYPDGGKEFVTSAMTGSHPMTVRIGERCNVGHGDLGWSTSPVQFIEVLGKGILFETLNSTYLLEEHERESKKHS